MMNGKPFNNMQQYQKYQAPNPYQNNQQFSHLSFSQDFVEESYDNKYQEFPHQFGHQQQWPNQSLPIYTELELPKVSDLPDGDSDAKIQSGKKYLDLQTKT
jgi:hypothetical protein